MGSRIDESDAAPLSVPGRGDGHDACQGFVLKRGLRFHTFPQVQARERAPRARSF
jgi:hypothetical protein